MKYISYYESPLGTLTLASDGSCLTGLWFRDQKYYAAKLDPDHEIKELEVFKKTSEWLDIYFSEKEPDFMPPLKFYGTDFRKEVWEILLTIPYGKTVTYKDIAGMIAADRGIKTMSSQAVGGAVGHNPISIIVPCHRVIGSDGSLTGYAGGLERKENLLKLEAGKSLLR